MKVVTNVCMVACMAALLMGCGSQRYSVSQNVHADSAVSRAQIGAMLDSFNLAAATASYDRYFGYLTDDAIFIGTDATEHWDRNTYMVWAKPYFEKKKTWNFTSIDRHIYFGKDNDIAWFDELLSTQMKICRGSGVVVRQNNQWKIQQYVLSMTIPNSQTRKVVDLKSPEEEPIITKLLVP